MSDLRRMTPEERARYRARMGLPQPLAGALCGNGGCAAHDLVTMPLSGCWPSLIDAVLGPTWQVCSGLRSWDVACLPRCRHCPGRCCPDTGERKSLREYLCGQITLNLAYSNDSDASQFFNQLIAYRFGADDD